MPNRSRPSGGGLSRSRAINLIRKYTAASNVVTGGRMVPNPGVSFGSPPVYAYTMSADEMVGFSDIDPAGTDVNITLPDAATVDPGQMVGLLLPVGNPTVNVNIIPAATDVILTPYTTPGPPGTTLSYAPGTTLPMARLVWMAVPAAPPTNPSPSWSFLYDEGGIRPRSGCERVEPLAGMNSMFAGGETIFRSHTWADPGTITLENIGAPFAPNTPDVPSYQVWVEIYGHIAVQTTSGVISTVIQPFSESVLIMPSGVLITNWQAGNMILAPTDPLFVEVVYDTGPNPPAIQLRANSAGAPGANIAVTACIRYTLMMGGPPPS